MLCLLQLDTNEDSLSLYFVTVTHLVLNHTQGWYMSSHIVYTPKLWNVCDNYGIHACVLSELLCLDWAEEAVEKAEILRLIYQGRFLHSNVTLGALGLPFGRTTVMHLVPRENLPEPNSQGETWDGQFMWVPKESF